MSYRMELALCWIVGITIVGGFVALSWAMLVVDQRHRQHRAEFMIECKMDRPQYECEALWGQAQGSGGSTVVPMPIVIPVR